MKIHILSGFLGSGKTTAIEQACNYLMDNGRSVGLIANDQGMHLVDGAFFNQLNTPTRQVLNGCFCCNYKDFEQSVDSLFKVHQPDIIFAESVGSCTDIVATVMKPILKLTEYKSVSPSTFADIRLLKMLLDDSSLVFHKSVRYIYFKQLEEASVIIVTKVDLVDEQILNEVRLMMAARYKKQVVLYQNSKDPDDIRDWLNILDDLDVLDGQVQQKDTSESKSLLIDYDTYGEGEARLAWFDQNVEIYSTQNACMDAVKLIRAIYDKLLELEYAIGHLKFFLDDKIKISFTTVPDAQYLDQLKLEKKPYIKLLINARVQTSPELLSDVMMKVIQDVKKELGCFIMIKDTASFQPGVPIPTHRILS